MSVLSSYALSTETTQLSQSIESLKQQSLNQIDATDPDAIIDPHCVCSEVSTSD